MGHGLGNGSCAGRMTNVYVPVVTVGGCGVAESSSVVAPSARCRLRFPRCGSLSVVVVISWCRPGRGFASVFLGVVAAGTAFVPRVIVVAP